MTDASMSVPAAGGEVPRAPKSARLIPVREARLIVLWPLVLQLPASSGSDPANAKTVAAAVRSLADRLGAPWTRVRDPVEHIAPADGTAPDAKAEAYAEVLYFHEFVQSFLFRKQEPGDPAPFHLFRRGDIADARVTFGREEVTKTLRVDRLNLYLFRTGAAVLVLELATPLDNGASGWTLAEFQDFHDHFRRVYAPFLDVRETAASWPCFKVPKRVAWLGTGGQPLPTPDGGHLPSEWSCESSLADLTQLIDRAEPDGRRRPPVFSHWRFLLGGALPLAGEPGRTGEGHWHQIVDDRMPTLAAVSLTPTEQGKPVWQAGDAEQAEQLARAALEAVRDGDLMRLCFADDQGEDPFPYDAQFLQRDFWQKNAYTRFRSMGTLYLLSGYAFVAIGAGRHFDTFHIGYVRRHYFQMGLLAHFELATLLAFSSQISRAAERLEQHDDAARFSDEMAGIEEQFLQFVHRFRFTGVSNQLQAQEMFDLWRQRLGLDAVFSDVQAEIRTANDFLSSRAQIRLGRSQMAISEAQTETSRAANRLSQVAAVGVVFGLAFSALGMNVLFNDEMLRGTTWRAQAAIISAAIAAFAGLGALLLFRLADRAATGPDSAGRGKRRDPLQWLLLVLFGAGFALAAVLALWGISYPGSAAR